MFKSKSQKKWLKNTFALVLTLVLIFTLFTGLSLANQDKISYGIDLAGIPIGGLTIDQAKQKLSQKIENFLNQEITLRYTNKNKNRIWTAFPEQLGVEINVNLSLSKAFKIGHEHNLLSNLWQQLLALLNRQKLSLIYTINQKNLEQFVSQNLNSINDPAINASWKYNQQLNQFVQIPSQSGTIVNQKKLIADLNKKILNLESGHIELSLTADIPKIVETETISAYKQANQIIENSPYRLITTSPLTQEETKLILSQQDIISLIKFQAVKDDSENTILGAGLNPDKLKQYLNTISNSINQDPVNAKFVLEQRRVTEFRPSQKGARLKIEKNIQKIEENILQGNKKINLETSIITPSITTEQSNDLGINTLLGKGVSNFGGSSWNRSQNIKIGAEQFNGVLIEPGEELSVNKTIGEVGPEQGYKQELIIKKDKTVPEYGGGLCQVSTTAFRAAVNSGLSITERVPHAFPVAYYNPQGFDATIYPPHPDLRFVNNTPGHVLIQTRTKGTNLIFEFYGTDDGREVKVEGPYQYDLKPDGSMKAILTRKIYKNKELIDEKSWYSNYKSPSLYPVERNPLE